MSIESAWTLLRGTWTYTLTVVDGQVITLGTVVVAAVLLFAGYRVSRKLSGTIGRVLVRRFQVESGPAAAIQTLAFYVLFVTFGVTALRIVHFPLTAFTILGGALAIGLGFGSQNIMNNFISGLILMLERPIRPGDLVQVEGTHGVVEDIGARSTRILASNNTHIIVPNSFFLENNVVNFTLSDDVLRTQLTVGVVYGSPTREAARLIRQVLEENEKVLRSPTPDILFADFGDNALIFEVFFWVRARRILEHRRIESEVRFRIDDLFRAAGIVIAFPQRDVHVDSVKPIEVRVVSRAAEDG